MHSADRLSGNENSTMLLHAARELAKEDKEDWYIVLHGEYLHIAKLVAVNCLHFVRVVDDDGAVLRFISIREAQEFLKNELSVSRKALYLEDVHWDSDEADLPANSPSTGRSN